MPVLREIESGDTRTRVFVEIEVAVKPAEAVAQEIEALHDYIVHHVRDWFGPEVGLSVATHAESEPEDV